MPTRVRTISYGGGVQSTALVVLAAQGVIDFPVALFANTGDDSEHPATLAYVRDVAMPWAAENGIEVHELRRTKKDGTMQTVRGEIEKGRHIIPFRGEGGMPLSRTCTVDFKIKVLGAWLKEHGATADNPGVVAIGISTDELERAGRGKDEAHERRVYPLLDLGMNRSDCEQVIADAGLPVPPKSACYFCPFHRLTTWQQMAEEEPELFWQAVEVERIANRHAADKGQRPVFLTRFGKPLDEIVDDSQLSLFHSGGGIGESGCDEGVCFV